MTTPYSIEVVLTKGASFVVDSDLIDLLDLLDFDETSLFATFSGLTDDDETMMLLLVIVEIGPLLIKVSILTVLLELLLNNIEGYLMVSLDISCMILAVSFRINLAFLSGHFYKGSSYSLAALFRSFKYPETSNRISPTFLSPFYVCRTISNLV